MNTSSLNKVLYGLFFASGIGYVIWLAFMEMPPESTNIPATILKATPVSILAILAFLNLEGRTRLLLGIGLVFGVGGDVCLNIYSGSQQTMFVFGLASFLVGHLLYVVLFVKEAKFEPNQLMWFVLVGGFAAGMGYMLWPKLQGDKGDLLIPVMVYILVITVMVIFAILHGKAGWRLVVGASFFMFSDSLIAFNSFVFENPMKAAYLVIMVTYYGGQFFIADAFLKHPEYAVKG